MDGLGNWRNRSSWNDAGEGKNSEEEREKKDTGLRGAQTVAGASVKFGSVLVFGFIPSVLEDLLFVSDNKAPRVPQICKRE